MIVDYLDPDVAYLLGMITARGKFIENRGNRTLIIDFPYKNLIAIGIKSKFDQETHLSISINVIRDRIYELIETDTKINKIDGSIQIVMRFLRNSMVWRNLRFLMQYRNTYEDFIIPEQIIQSDIELQKEYIRGIADVSGYIRHSNNYMGQKRRVYLEISNRNWFLPVQLCDLLQQKLDVPVQLIQWGHPNTREPNLNKPGTTWAREHQIKIFAEAFEKIGFYVNYKNQILKEFIAEDLKLSGTIHKCNPNPEIRRFKAKPPHVEENSNRLPDLLKGNHFDSYWQICTELGCTQRIDTGQYELLLEPEEETSE